MPNNSHFTPEQIQEILDLYFQNFAHRQYIGARYVPIFGRKDEESIIWDNTGTYEPLTIVLYQGNSYTSRQFVPAGVDILNQDYWANTGNYNAQVEQYRQTVLAFDDRITANASDIDALEERLPKATFDSTNTVKKYIDDRITANASDIDALEERLPKASFDSTNTVKKYIDDEATVLQNQIDSIETTYQKCIVTFGDSYGDTVDQGADNVWTVELARRLNLELHNYCEGSAGYVRNGRLGHNFIGEVDLAIADTSFDNDDVRYIVVYGGYNDVATSQATSTFSSNVAQMLSTLKTNFPKSEIIVFGINTGIRPLLQNVDELSRDIEYYRLLDTACANAGVQLVNTIGWNWGNTSAYKTDGIHPNNYGRNLIVSMMLENFGQKKLNCPVITMDYSNGSIANPTFILSSFNDFTKITKINGNSPIEFSLIMEFEATTARGTNSHDGGSLITLLYWRNCLNNIITPIYKFNTTENIWEYFGYTTRKTGENTLVFIKETKDPIQVGDKFITGPIPFFGAVDFEEYTVTHS